MSVCTVHDQLTLVVSGLTCYFSSVQFSSVRTIQTRLNSIVDIDTTTKRIGGPVPQLLKPWDEQCVA